MNGTEEVTMSCPFCGETIELVVDLSIESQRYIEDCPVCCRPIFLNVEVNGRGEVVIDARREDE